VDKEIIFFIHKWVTRACPYIVLAPKTGHFAMYSDITVNQYYLQLFTSYLRVSGGCVCIFDASVGQKK